MAPVNKDTMLTLDSEELCVVRDLFKNGDVKDDGRISVAEVLACVEEMDFIVDGSLLDLIKSVVPEAVEVDRLSLNDAVQVAAAAKAQDQGGSGAPVVPSINREDSLAELEISFNRRVRSGELTADVIEEEPQAPSIGLIREDSLAQLKSSYRKQALSGNLPEVVMEGPEGYENGAPPKTAVVGLDVPQRRRSIAGPSPALPSRSKGLEHKAPPGMAVVGVDVPQRRRSIAGSYPAPSSPRNTAQGVKPRGDLNLHAAEPVVVDDLPKRRSSVGRPGGGSLVGLDAEGVKDIYDDDGSTLPASPEMFKQTSEMELLDTAGSLGVEPVEESSVPVRRQSFAVSQSWREAISQESAKALEAKNLADAQKAEAAREQAESEKIRAEVDAYLSRLTDQVEHDSAIAQAREEAEKRARAVELEVQKAQAAAARLEVEAALQLVVVSLDRDAAVAAVKEDAERLIKEEAEAREAAEMKAAEAAKRAEEALRLVAHAEEAKAMEESSREAARVRDEEQAVKEKEERAREEAARLKSEEEDRVKDDARRALQAEAELLRSKLEEAGKEAAERAQEAQAKAQKKAEELKKAEEQAEREARLAEEVERSLKREMQAREAADREARVWEKKFDALQRDMAEEVDRTKKAARQELERAVEEARAFEKAKVLALRETPEERHPLDGAQVSFDDVDGREGKKWWQCVICVPNESPDEGANSENAGEDDDDNEDDASVGRMKPGHWTRSPGFSASTTSMERPGKGDACTIS
ncbi:unnamed protein product [Pylaiella littoralis]